MSEVNQSFKNGTASAFPVHSQYEFHRQDWQRLRDSFQGQARIKKMTTKYLPKLPGQDDTDYKAYLQRAVYFNTIKRTVNGLLGSIFRLPVEIENKPDKLRLDSISYEGMDFSQFCMNVAKELVLLNRYGVLVDKPISSPEDPNPSAYFAGYTAEQIVNWKTKRVNGREVLIEVVLQEAHAEYQTWWQREEKIHFRRLYLEDGVYHQDVFEMDEHSKQPNIVDTFIPLRRGETMDFIPFQFFDAEGNLPDIHQSPLLDVLELNLSHYKASADLEHGRHYTAMPVYWTTSGDDDTEFFVGPNIVWKIAQGDQVGILEFNGQGLIFLENSCDQKERQMAQLGARLIGNQRKMAAEGSYSAVLRERGDMSTLLGVTNSMNAGMTKIINWKAWWDGRAESSVVKFNQDFSDGDMTHREWRVIQMVYESGIMPISLVFQFFRNAGVISADVTEDEFLTMLNDRSQVPNPQTSRFAGPQNFNNEPFSQGETERQDQ